MSVMHGTTLDTASASADALLRIEALHVHFGAQQVVHDLNLELRAGEKFALVG